LEGLKTKKYFCKDEKQKSAKLQGLKRYLNQLIDSRSFGYTLFDFVNYEDTD